MSFLVNGQSIAMNNGYTHEEFQKGIEMYMNGINGPEPDLEAEAQQAR